MNNLNHKTTDLSYRTVNMNERLIEACKIGDLKEVAKLVGLGVDIRTNEEALRWACRYGNLDIVKYLVGLGANTRNSIFQCAPEYNHLDIVKYLVDIGVNIRYNE